MKGIRVKMLVGTMILTMVSFVFATPQSMRIGTFALSNGPTGLDSASSLKSSANAFFAAAERYRPSTGPAPVRVINMEDNHVTKSSLEAKKDSVDFLFVGAHGNQFLMAVWNATQTGSDYWRTSDMKFGTNNGNVRWVLLESCLVLRYKDNQGQDFFDSWKLAFKGVQAVIGYGSSLYSSVPSSIAKNTRFWERWTHPTAPGGLWNSHAEATEHAVFQGLGLGIRPAIVGAKSSSGGEFGRIHTYTQSTLERGVAGVVAYTTWIDYGTPHY